MLTFLGGGLLEDLPDVGGAPVQRLAVQLLDAHLQDTHKIILPTLRQVQKQEFFPVFRVPMFLSLLDPDPELF